MTFLTKEKTKLTFEDRLNKKAPGTREVYKIAFRNFEKFCEDHYSRTMEEVISELDVVDEETIYETLQDWIDWNVLKKKNPATIRPWFSIMVFERDNQESDLNVPKHTIRNLTAFQKGRGHLGQLILKNMAITGGTDVDWLVERKGGFLVLECKEFHDNKITIPLGQMIAFEKLHE